MTKFLLIIVLELNKKNIFLFGSEGKGREDKSRVTNQIICNRIKKNVSVFQTEQFSFMVYPLVSSFSILTLSNVYLILIPLIENCFKITYHKPIF